MDSTRPAVEQPPTPSGGASDVGGASDAGGASPNPPTMGPLHPHGPAVGVSLAAPPRLLRSRKRDRGLRGRGDRGTSAQVLSEIVPENDSRAPRELASRTMVAPRSGPWWDGAGRSRGLPSEGLLLATVALG